MSIEMCAPPGVLPPIMYLIRYDPCSPDNQEVRATVGQNQYNQHDLVNLCLRRRSVRKFVCQTCDFTFQNKIKLVRHTAIEHSTVQTDLKRDSPEETGHDNLGDPGWTTVQCTPTIVAKTTSAAQDNISRKTRLDKVFKTNCQSRIKTRILKQDLVFFSYCELSLVYVPNFRTEVASLL